MIPSYFKIEILAIQDDFVLLGHKGLNYTVVTWGSPVTVTEGRVTEKMIDWRE